MLAKAGQIVVHIGYNVLIIVDLWHSLTAVVNNGWLMDKSWFTMIEN